MGFVQCKKKQTTNFFTSVEGLKDLLGFSIDVRYGDDYLLVLKSEEKLKEVLNNVANKIICKGIIINCKKTGDPERFNSSTTNDKNQESSGI